MTHAEYAAGLKLIADWWEQHPEIPLPHSAEEFQYFSAHTKEEMARLALSLGTCDKQFDDMFFRVERSFGQIRFVAYASRADVCERIVVGKKVIPASIVELPAHTEDIVEWRCPDSILSGVTRETTHEQ